MAIPYLQALIDLNLTGNQLLNVADGLLDTDGVNLGQIKKLLDDIGKRQRAVIAIVDNTAVPPTEINGDRYILDNTGASNAAWDGASAWEIVEFNSTSGLWEAKAPEEGMTTYVDDENKDAVYVDDGTPVWELRTPFVLTDHIIYYVGKHGSDANNGKTANGAFLTLEKALDIVEGVGGGAIYIVDDGTYEVQAASGTRTDTSNIILIAPMAKVEGPVGGLVWRLPSNNMQILRVDGTNLIFEPQGTGQVFQHVIRDIDNPETLYRGRSGNINVRFQISALYAFGTGVFVNATNGAKGQININEGSFVFNSANDESPFISDGANTSLVATVQNLDVINAGAGDAYAVISDNSGMAFIQGQCSSATFGAKADNSASAYVFLSNTGGGPLPNTEAGGGKVVSHSLGEGLNFAELDTNAALAGGDLINIRDISTGQQVTMTLTELDAFIATLGNFVTIATVQDVTGAKTFTAPLTVEDGTGSGLAANAIADCFVFTSSNINAGMSLMTIAGGNSNVFFGETGNSDKAAHIQYIGSVNELRLGAGNVNVQRISSTNVLFETKIQVRDGGVFRFDVETDGTLTVGDTPSYEALVTDDDDIPNKKYVDDEITAAEGITAAVATTNATTTEIDKIDTLLNEYVYMIEVKATAKSDDDLQWGMWSFILTVTKFGGVPVIRQTDVIAHNSSAGLNSGSISFAVNTGDIDIDVTGIAATNIQWNLSHKLIISSTN